MLTIETFTFGPSAAPIFQLAREDRATSRAAAEVAAEVHRLAGQTCAGNVLALAAAESVRTGELVSSIVHRQLTALQAARVGLTTWGKHVDGVLAADRAERCRLDPAAGLRLEVAELRARLLADELRQLDQPNDDAVRLRAAGLTETEVARILGARGLDQDGRRPHLQGQRAGWMAEARVLREFLADVLRDPARLGRLQEPLESVRERLQVPGGEDRVRSEWLRAGPLDLTAHA